MKILSSFLTIFSSTVIWFGSLFATVVVGWLVFCWQCGAEESGSTWLFWPLVYLIALGAAYLFSKLPDKFGGDNWGLAAITMLILGATLHLVS